MSAPTKDQPVTDERLPVLVQRMVIEGQVQEALGAYYLTKPCSCGRFGAGQTGWAIITVEPGLQLHWCSDCGRPAQPNRDKLLGDPPLGKGDVAVWYGALVELMGAPGPTGAVRLRLLDDPTTELTAHVLQLNLED